MIHASENKSKDVSTQTVHESLIVNISKALDIPATIQEDLEGDAHQKFNALFITNTKKSTKEKNDIRAASNATGQAENDYEDRYPRDTRK